MTYLLISLAVSVALIVTGLISLVRRFRAFPSLHRRK